MPKIGPYTLHAIETGRFSLDGGAMFGIVPQPLWKKKSSPDSQNRILLAMRCLLLVSDDKIILIDNGLGDKYDAKFAKIFGVNQEHSELHHSLAGLGYSTDDVTDVILTHLHFDHCGGSTRLEGKELVPTFKKAMYHVQADHWNWAMESNEREKNSFLKDNFAPIEAAGQLNLIYGKLPLFKGIELPIINGHTHAQQMVKVHGEEGVLVFVADLIPTAAHVPLPWIMGYDLFPFTTLQEKTEFLAQAEAENWHIMLEHDPENEIINITKTERGGYIATNPRSLANLHLG